MKSGYYIAIFIAVIAIVSGLIWYNANTIENINDETVTIEKASVTKKDEDVVVQKEINVLTDVDFEEDVDDLVDPENLSDFDAVDDLVVDEEVIL